jgi:hypothetical protein
MIDLLPVRDFARGHPYDQPGLLQCCRDLTDTVFKTHFRNFTWDEELYSVAMLGILRVIRKGGVDTSRSPVAFFSYMYSTVRNSVGNYLKKEFRRSRGGHSTRPEEVHLTGGVMGNSSGNSSGPEAVAIVRASVSHEAQAIFDRLRECGIPEGEYARDVAGASVFRVLALAG